MKKIARFLRVSGASSIFMKLPGKYDTNRVRKQVLKVIKQERKYNNDPYSGSWNTFNDVRFGWSGDIYSEDEGRDEVLKRSEKFENAYAVKIYDETKVKPIVDRAKKSREKFDNFAIKLRKKYKIPHYTVYQDTSDIYKVATSDELTKLEKYYDNYKRLEKMAKEKKEKNTEWLVGGWAAT